MAYQSDDAWVIWLLIALFLIVCIGIIIWMAIVGQPKTIT